MTPAETVARLHRGVMAMTDHQWSALFALLGRMLNRWLHPVPAAVLLPAACLPIRRQSSAWPVLVRAGPARQPVCPQAP